MQGTAPTKLPETEHGGAARQSAFLGVQPCPDQPIFRGVLAALLSAVSAPAAFVCVARQGGRPCDLARVVDGHTQFALASQSLEETFGFHVAPRAASRVTSNGDGGAEEDRASAAYWREHSLPNGLSRALVVSLCDGDVPSGLAGVERRADDPRFSALDANALEILVPLLVQATRARRRAEERGREVAALRAIGDVRGAVLVVDCQKRRIVSISSPEGGSSATPPTKSTIQSIVKAVTRLMLAPAESQVTIPFRLGRTVVLSVVPIGEDGGGIRYAAVHLASADGGHSASDTLSPREREVAKLLVAGYSNVNIAALCGLSPNTVRTFMRRLYAKLGVFNRADLVRELVHRPLV
jgi:DNA-binding CsgD family transcriptional regulator